MRRGCSLQELIDRYARRGAPPRGRSRSECAGSCRHCCSHLRGINRGDAGALLAEVGRKHSRLRFSSALHAAVVRQYEENMAAQYELPRRLTVVAVEHLPGEHFSGGISTGVINRPPFEPHL